MLYNHDIQRQEKLKTFKSIFQKSHLLTYRFFSQLSTSIVHMFTKFQIRQSLFWVLFFFTTEKGNSGMAVISYTSLGSSR